MPHKRGLELRHEVDACGCRSRQSRGTDFLKLCENKLLGLADGVFKRPPIRQVRGNRAGQHAARSAHRSGKARRIEADGFLTGTQQNFRGPRPRCVPALGQHDLRPGGQQSLSLAQDLAVVHRRS